MWFTQLRLHLHIARLVLIMCLKDKGQILQDLQWRSDFGKERLKHQ